MKSRACALVLVLIAAPGIAHAASDLEAQLAVTDGVPTPPEVPPEGIVAAGGKDLARSDGTPLGLRALEEREIAKRGGQLPENWEPFPPGLSVSDGTPRAS